MNWKTENKDGEISFSLLFYSFTFKDADFQFFDSRSFALFSLFLKLLHNRILKVQTEHFMEKEDVRKYIPSFFFLNSTAS